MEIEKQREQISGPARWLSLIWGSAAVYWGLKRRSWLGSAVALASGLLLTWIVILFLPAEQARFAPEHAALVRAVLVFTAFAAFTAASFYGEQRERHDRKSGGRDPSR